MGDDEKKQLILEQKQLLAKKLEGIDEQKKLSLDDNSKKLVYEEEGKNLEKMIQLVEEEKLQVIAKEKEEESKKLESQYEFTLAQKRATIYKTFALLIVVFGIIIVGLYLAFRLENFALVPFSVVLTGIVAFFGVLIISNQLADKDDLTGGEMRRAITVAIVVVYLGLLPTLAFQGILQFNVLGLESSEVALNQTIQTVPQTIKLTDTVITSFTTLVTAVILFYFGMRSWEEVKKLEVQNKEN